MPDDRMIMDKMIRDKVITDKIEEAVVILEKLTERELIFYLRAKAYKLSLDTLMSEGFSREEAMRIIVAQNPMVIQMQKKEKDEENINDDNVAIPGWL